MKRKIKLFDEEFPNPLPEKEQNEYILLAQAGDLAARDKLIEHNLRLISYVILNLPEYYLEMNHILDEEDLMVIGSFALIKAIAGYKFDQGAAFSTYAITSIRKEIVRGLTKRKSAISTVSMSDAISTSSEGDQLLVEDVLQSEQRVEEENLRIESREIVRKALNILNDKERTVIELAYGFNGKPLKSPEIAQIFGCTRSNISRIKISAEKKLATHLGDKGFGRPRKAEKVMKFVFDLDGEEKATFYANAIIETEMTIEELAKRCGVTPYSIKVIIGRYLPKFDTALHDSYLEVVDRIYGVGANIQTTSEKAV